MFFFYLYMNVMTIIWLPITFQTIVLPPICPLSRDTLGLLLTILSCRAKRRNPLKCYVMIFRDVCWCQCILFTNKKKCPFFQHWIWKASHSKNILLNITTNIRLMWNFTIRKLTNNAILRSLMVVSRLLIVRFEFRGPVLKYWNK